MVCSNFEFELELGHCLSEGLFGVGVAREVFWAAVDEDRQSAGVGFETTVIVAANVHELLVFGNILGIGGLSERWRCFLQQAI